MKYKFFSIPARNPEASEAELNAFCSQHRISFIDKHWVADRSVISELNRHAKTEQIS